MIHSASTVLFLLRTMETVHYSYLAIVRMMQTQKLEDLQAKSKFLVEGFPSIGHVLLTSRSLTLFAADPEISGKGLLIRSLAWKSLNINHMPRRKKTCSLKLRSASDFAEGSLLPNSYCMFMCRLCSSAHFLDIQIFCLNSVKFRYPGF